MIYHHQPVLLEEVIRYLKPEKNQNFIDGTLGGGGHTLAILEKTAPEGKVLAIDLDPAAHQEVKSKSKKLKIKKERLILVEDNFKNLKNILDKKRENLGLVHGILLDLGLSSAQIDDRSRGFSFESDESLDMRFNPESDDLTAQEIINTYPEDKLARIFRDYGEERLARPISQEIIKFRKNRKFETPQMLVEAVLIVYKKYYKTISKKNPSTKVFQSLRITVNDELESLKQVLPQALEILTDGGKLVVISYHSLEDKIVKDFFRRESKGCLCAPESPICQCHHEPQIKIITKKPMVPTRAEIIQNHRARSAKMRVAKKLKTKD